MPDSSEIEYIFDMREPQHAALAAAYRGSYGTVTARRLADLDYEGYLHDGQTPGGIKIWSTFAAGAGTADHLNSISLVGSVLTVDQISGLSVSVDLASVVPAGQSLVGLAIDAAGILTATMASGATIPVDLAQLEDKAITSFALNGSVMEITLEDGTVIPADLGPLVDGAIASVSIVGDDMVTTDIDGTLTTVSLASYQETLVLSAPHVFTFNDGDGNLTTIDLHLNKLEGTLLGTNYISGQPHLEGILRALDTQMAVIAGATGGTDLSVASVTVVPTGPSNSLVTLTMSDGSTIPFTTLDADVDTTVNYVSGAMVGNNLVLTDNLGGTLTVDISGAGGSDTTSASMGLSGTVLTLTDSAGNNVQVDLASIDTDTDTDTTNNTLSLTGNVLRLTDTAGNNVTVDLSTFNTDTDTQITNASIGFSGSALTVTDSAGGLVTVDLGPMLNAFDDDTTVVSANLLGNNLILTNNLGASLSVAMGSMTAANGIESMTTAGTVLTVHRGDGSLRTVDLATLISTASNTKIATVLTAGTVLTITDTDSTVFTVDLAPLIAGADAGNGVASAALAGSIYTLTLEDGTTVAVDLAGLSGTSNTSMVLSPLNILTLTDSASNTVTVDLTTLAAIDIDALPDHSIWALGDTIAKEDAAGDVQEATMDAYIASILTIGADAREVMLALTAPTFATYGALQDDTVMTLTADDMGTVALGDIIHAGSNGVYQVMAAASDVVTAGGINLMVLPVGANNYDAKHFLVGVAPDVTTATQRLQAAADIAAARSAPAAATLLVGLDVTINDTIFLAPDLTIDLADSAVRMADDSFRNVFSNNNGRSMVAPFDGPAPAGWLDLLDDNVRADVMADASIPSASLAGTPLTIGRFRYEVLVASEAFYADTPLINALGTRFRPAIDRGIRIIGNGNSLIEHNGLFNWSREYLSYRRDALTFAFIDDLQVTGVTVKESARWAVCLEHASNCLFDITVDNAGYQGRSADPGTYVLGDFSWRSEPGLRNQDGINFRQGCYDNAIIGLRGTTGDNAVAFTAINPINTEAGRKYTTMCNDYAPYGADIMRNTVSNVNVNNVGAQQTLRVLVSDGHLCHQATFDNITDVMTTKDVAGNAYARSINEAMMVIGDTAYGVDAAEYDDISNIVIQNSITTARLLITYRWHCREVLVTNCTHMNSREAQGEVVVGEQQATFKMVSGNIATNIRGETMQLQEHVYNDIRVNWDLEAGTDWTNEGFFIDMRDGAHLLRPKISGITIEHCQSFMRLVNADTVVQNAQISDIHVAKMGSIFVDISPTADAAGCSGTLRDFHSVGRQYNLGFAAHGIGPEDRFYGDDFFLGLDETCPYVLVEDIVPMAVNGSEVWIDRLVAGGHDFDHRMLCYAAGSGRGWVPVRSKHGQLASDRNAVATFDGSGDIIITTGLNYNASNQFYDGFSIQFTTTITTVGGEKIGIDSQTPVGAREYGTSSILSAGFIDVAAAAEGQAYIASWIDATGRWGVRKVV